MPDQEAAPSHILAIDRPEGSGSAVMFRSTGAELEIRRTEGHPYAMGWEDAAMVFLDQDTD